MMHSACSTKDRWVHNESIESRTVVAMTPDEDPALEAGRLYKLVVTNVDIRDYVGNEVEMELLQRLNRVFVGADKGIRNRSKSWWITRKVIGTGPKMIGWAWDQISDEDLVTDNMIEDSDVLLLITDDDERERRLREKLEEWAEKLLVRYDLTIATDANANAGAVPMNSSTGAQNPPVDPIELEQQCLVDYRTTWAGQRVVGYFRAPAVGAGTDLSNHFNLTIRLKRKSKIGEALEKGIERLEEEGPFKNLLGKAVDQYGAEAVGEVVGEWIDKKVKEHLEDNYAPEMDPVATRTHFHWDNAPYPAERPVVVHKLVKGQITIRIQLTGDEQARNNPRSESKGREPAYSLGAITEVDGLVLADATKRQLFDLAERKKLLEPRGQEPADEPHTPDIDHYSQGELIFLLKRAAAPKGVDFDRKKKPENRMTSEEVAKTAYMEITLKVVPLE